MTAQAMSMPATGWSPFDDQQTAPFALPALPFSEQALAPVISSSTLAVHHGKHHRAYVDKLNGLVDKTKLAGQPLVEIIRKTARSKANVAVFNNAAQTWNHTFYWHSMTHGGGGKPTGALAAAIERDFGGFDAFRKAFADAAVGQFGSGWAWLVVEGGKLKVIGTSNADTPVAHDQTPLITIDVWEHAYYLDYQNRRPDYVNAWLDQLANWSFAADNFSQVPAVGA